MNTEMTLDEIIEFYRVQCEAQALLDEADDTEDEKFTKMEKYHFEQDDDER